jgi:HD domain
MTTLSRRLDEGRGTLLLLGLTLVLVVVSVVLALQHPLHQASIALSFGAFIAVGEAVRVTLAGDREAAPLGAAAALAYALIGRFGSEPTSHTVWDVIAVTAAASMIGAVPHIAAGRSPRLDVLARRILSVGVAAALFRPFYHAGMGPWGRLEMEHKNGWLASVMVVIVVLAGLFDAAVAALVRADRDRAPFLSSLRSEFRALIGLSSAIGATGVLIALAAQVMRLWAIPVFVIPLMLTQFSFRRYAGIRNTYAQTIRSLSRVTEVGGYTETGHSRRVSELALGVGRELGLSDADLVDLEYAALMHDLGQLSLAEPIPGGATVMAMPDEQRRIAEMGAEVIRQTGVLDRVAVIVERQAEPYRRPHETVDDTIPLASRIIKAANAYDDMVGDSRESSRRLEALERLRLSMAYDYDPKVVTSLAHVVERSNRLGL